MQDKAPPRRRPKNLAGYLEALSRPVFQAGISRRVIESKWDGIREVFAGFDPEIVAQYDQADVDRLLTDPRAVRSKPKLEAIIDNAQALIELNEEHGSFRRYLESHSSFEETVADLQRQFRFIGDSGAYHFLWSVNERTPPHEEWFSQTARRTPTGPRRATPARHRTASTPGRTWP